jgi:predicted transcriptional regulator
MGICMEKVNVTCRLNVEDVAFLDTLGSQIDRDRSYLIKQAVSSFIHQQRWQVEEVKLALKEAAEGKTLSDEAFEADVQAWR